MYTQYLPTHAGSCPVHWPQCESALPGTGAHTYKDGALSCRAEHLMVQVSPSLATLTQSVLSNMARGSMGMGGHFPHTGWLGGACATHTGLFPVMREGGNSGRGAGYDRVMCVRMWVCVVCARVCVSFRPEHLMVYVSPSLATLTQSVLSYMARGSMGMGGHFPHTGWLGGACATYTGLFPASRCTCVRVCMYVCMCMCMCVCVCVCVCRCVCARA